MDTAPGADDLAGLRAQLADARAERDEWRARALAAWEQAAEMVGASDEFGDSAEVAAMRASLSWRVTRPLRAVRTVQRRLGR